MIKKYIKILFLYLSGAFGWLVLFALLQKTCVLNLPLRIDGLWTQQVNENLVRNLIGDLAYRTSGLGCDDKLVYTARYYANGVSGDYQTRTLTSLIDTASWRQVDSDSISISYVDQTYKYILYSSSDGIYMRVFDQ